MPAAVEDPAKPAVFAVASGDHQDTSSVLDMCPDYSSSRCAAQRAVGLNRSDVSEPGALHGRGAVVLGVRDHTQSPPWSLAELDAMLG